jgi:F0F1-type ATP synthase epsilon subunit
VTILSDAAELEEDIDVARARAAKARAEEQMRTEHSAEVEGDLRRAHARLAATGGIEASH